MDPPWKDNPEELSDADLATACAAARDQLAKLSAEACKRDKAKRETLAVYLNQQKVRYDKYLSRISVLKNKVMDGQHISFDTDEIDYFIQTGDWHK
jgi:hypothetical protein